MLNKRADKLELLRIAEAVALEKSIDKELIINSMETGIAKAAKSKFGQDNEIKVSINRDNGDIEIFRKLIVTENPENSNTEIRLEDAINLNEVNKEKSIGDEVLQPLPTFDFGIDFNIYGLNKSLTSVWLTSAECCEEITTDFTFDGFPSIYSKVTWLLESGSIFLSLPDFLSSAISLKILCE